MAADNKMLKLEDGDWVFCAQIVAVYNEDNKIVASMTNSDTSELYESDCEEDRQAFTELLIAWLRPVGNSSTEVRFLMSKYFEKKSLDHEEKAQYYRDKC